MRAVKVLGILMILAALGPQAQASEWDAVRVLSTVGTVEIQRASRGAWKPAAASQRLSSGDRIRTGSESSVDVGLDAALDGMARLGENSQAVLREPADWQLERGRFWLLWEYDRSARGAFALRIRSWMAEAEGGLYAQITGSSAQVRSFGSVRLADGRGTGELEEGYFCDLSPSTSGWPQRMGFAFYQDWRLWMTDAYRQKDALRR